MKKMYCVVSHTHWDREWYQPFEVFRMQLVDLIDHLLDIIEKHPSFIFHLDAQTVVLEDYLEIRPHKREALKTLITKGNILVGPWYLQNDFYLTSGEATIRNLIEGRRLATEFGACSGVGYAPDQFGNISQLPQILRNFGIDNFIFGRGYSQFHKNEAGEMVTDSLPSEFLWQGADGTEALAIHMRHWYNNAQRFSADSEKAIQLVKMVEDSFENVAVTPYLLLMNGVDHLEAQEDLLPILENLNHMKINGHIKQIKMQEYVDQVRKYITEHALPMTVHKGELRAGGDYEILQGTLSSRHYLKIANVRAQNMLENRLEPLYSMLELSGCKQAYPLDHLRYLWKKLMQNHPHDSICGCSRDEVHRHMEDNYGRIEEAGGELLKRGLQIAAYHNAVAAAYPESYSLIAVNTLGTPVSGVIEAELLFPADDSVEGFAIYDREGKKIEYALLSREKRAHDVFSPVNLPGSIVVDCCRVYLFVSDVQPAAFKGYSIRKDDVTPSLMERKSDDIPVLENEYLKVEISMNGAVEVLVKATGRVLPNCLYIEDTGDKGDSYVYSPADESPILSSEFTPKITVTEKNAYVSRCHLLWNMELPAFYDFAGKRRSGEKAVMPVSLTLTLKKGQETLEVDYCLDNRVKEHRLRLVAAGDVFNTRFMADIPFDIIEHEDGQHHPNTVSEARANTSFAAIEQDGKGMVIFTQGAHECEKLKESALAFTMVRSTGMIISNPDGTLSGDQWLCPDNQCIRTIKGRLGLLFYSGKAADAALPCRSLEFRNPLLVCFAPCDRRRFSGGRPAVQDTKLSELFYRPDPYEGIGLPDNQSLLHMSSKSVVLSAFKKSEDGKGMIIRLFNYSTNEERVTVSIRGSIMLSNMAEDDKTLLGINEVQLTMEPKKIVTLYVE